MKVDYLIQHCSPTLANLKTANMFTCDADDPEFLDKYVKSFNQSFYHKGIKMTILRLSKQRALCYIYRPSRLQCDLQCPIARDILEDLAYPVNSTAACLVCIKQRLKNKKEFPHEIGLFLGYPPEDVAGFIVNKARNEKYLGTWKVYSDVEAAQKCFASFKNCRKEYERAWFEGKCNLDELIVAS
ncbi:MAG: DUF3793 family protein [Epulopiscium sp.]|nr:DUF3793 family protein [Candidatus Epulonipiscium sp.]